MKGDIEQELRGHRCSHGVGGSEMTRGRGVEEQSPMAVATQLSSPHSWTPTTVVCAVCQVAENSGFKPWCTTMELGQGTPQLPDVKNWDESSASEPPDCDMELPPHSQKQASFLFTFLHWEGDTPPAPFSDRAVFPQQSVPVHLVWASG